MFAKSRALEEDGEQAGVQRGIASSLERESRADHVSQTNERLTLPLEGNKCDDKKQKANKAKDDND